jgi:hypothetical protein
MQLKIKRSQEEKKTGFFGGGREMVFTLSVRAEYTAQESADIQKYQLAGSRVYQTDIDDQSKTAIIAISIGSLAQGHSINCKDISELQFIEEKIIASCRQLQVYLEVAESFDGREILLDFNKNDAAAAAA